MAPGRARRAVAALLLAAASAACGDPSPRRTARPPDTDSIRAVAENPDVPPAIVAGVADFWGWSDLARGLWGQPSGPGRARRAREYEIHGWCGSSGVCVSYVYRRDSTAGYARILSAETWEAPLKALRHSTHGFHDIRSTAPPDGASVQGPAIYRYDSAEYRRTGFPW
jgi:hypothetical protein